MTVNVAPPVAISRSETAVGAAIIATLAENKPADALTLERGEWRLERFANVNRAVTHFMRK